MMKNNEESTPGRIKPPRIESRVAETAPSKCAPHWRGAIRWLVLGNPFYPLSAVFVLLGVLLLSGEERMFGSELRQLYFNFGSVEFYGLLVATTAVYLFRRQIYYDTLMLVVLATMPVLVPFILISQAALIGDGIMVMLCVLAVLLGGFHCWLLRRGVFELPLNSGISVFVCLVLGLNLVLPIALKTLHAEVDAIVWAVQLEQAGRWTWSVLLPFLVFGGFLVREMNRRMFGDCAVGWLPLVLMLLLTAGTALHVCSLGYVYSFPFAWQHIYPVTWACLWLIWWRRDEWRTPRVEKLARTVVVLPAVFGLLAWFEPSNVVLLLINAVNTGVFLRLALQGRSPAVIRACGLASSVGLLRSVPTIWLIDWLPDTTHLQLILLVASCAVFAFSWLRRTPGWGIAAAGAVGFPLQHLWLGSPGDGLVLGQFVLLTWWVHSLFWALHEKKARALQSSCVVVWCLQSVVWFLSNGGEGRLDLVFFAAVFALSAGSKIWLGGGGRYWAIAVVAGAVAGLGGIDEVAAVIREIPGGAILLMTGLVLFALGTVLARWRRNLMGRGFAQHSFDGNNF